VSTRLQLVDDPAHACAEVLLDAIQRGGHIVLTGGSTPKAAYSEVAGVLGGGHDLRGTTLWFGDERCVPPEDDRSNYKMARESLLEAMAGPTSPTVHRMKGELGPEDGAADYERQLHEAGTPPFDLLLLGMGPDGHLASLFPDQETLQERSQLVVGVPEAGLEPFVPRISLTLPALASARRVVFLVSGESKAEAVAAAFGAGSAPDPHVPSSLLEPLGPEITVLLDAAAASRIHLDPSG
jgi:6-phosphogluconolactonase